MKNRFWFLVSKKMSGEAIDAELDELDGLLAEHPEWHYSVQHIHSIWEDNPDIRSSTNDFEQHWHRMQAMLQQDDLESIKQEKVQFQNVVPLNISQSKRKWWVIAAVATGLVGLSLLAVLFASQGVNSKNATAANTKKNEVATRSGSRTKVELPDGTQVWLNAESKLEYSDAFGKTNRDVTLNGEAYFDVVKNTALPFIIHTKKIKIRVTGTAFNVKAYSTERVSETSIIRGRVEVTVNARPDEKYVLMPNEKLVVRDEMASDKSNTTAANRKPSNEPLILLGHVNFLEKDSAVIETSWVYNRLIFDDESFADIVQKMERWYGIGIKINNEKLAATHFTYQIKNETVEKALRNMQYAAKFRYTVSNNTITITK